MLSRQDAKDFSQAIGIRRGRLRARLGGAAFVLVAQHLLSGPGPVGDGPMVGLFAAYVALQLLEHRLVPRARIRDFEEAPVWRGVTAGLIALQSCVVGTFAVLCVFDVPLHALALTMATMIAIMIGTITASRGSRDAFLCGFLPQALFLIGLLPLAGALTGEPTWVAGSAGVSAAVLVTAAVAGWREYSRILRAEHAARLEANLRRAEAESATAAKSAFVAIVGHELRTPITAIQAGAAALEASAQDATRRNDAGLIVEAARMMRTLLDDLLDLSKLDAGRMRVEAIPFDARLLVGNAARFWRSEARKRGLRLTLSGARHLPRWLTGDPTRIRQILNNLFSNALKFTESGGVTLRIGHPEPGVLTLSVEDTGAGMSPAQLERLFTPFEQADETVARTHGGTGLGLVISRDLARLMDGDLTVSSGVGEGSTFSLTIPERSAAAPDAEAETASAPMLPDRLRVLVVDDHEINRRALTLVLQPFDVDLTLASGGRQALAQLAAQSFDVVLTDIHMPEMDGIELTQRIRDGAGRNRDVAIIAITGAVEAAARAEYAAAGVNGCVTKPIEPAELFAVIEAVLAADAEAPAAPEALSA